MHLSSHHNHTHYTFISSVCKGGAPLRLLIRNWSRISWVWCIGLRAQAHIFYWTSAPPSVSLAIDWTISISPKCYIRITVMDKNGVPCFIIIHIRVASERITYSHSPSTKMLMKDTVDYAPALCCPAF